MSESEFIELKDLQNAKKIEIEHPKSQIDIIGVTCGPRYPLIRLQALCSLAGIRYYH